MNLKSLRASELVEKHPYDALKNEQNRLAIFEKYQTKNWLNSNLEA